MHSMNPPVVQGSRAFVSCACGWHAWVDGIKLDPTDRDLHYQTPAETAWVDHMETLLGKP